jgi:Holliday junction DNA helicase RuvA
MIAGLLGRVHRVASDSVLLDVHGVVYRVLTSGRTITELGQTRGNVEMFTYMVVREDAQTLFGFLSEMELLWFETLIAVNGVGPRLACAVLTRFTPDALLEAISREDVALLSTVSGIGKRTASRIMLDLRGKLPEGISALERPVRGEEPEVLAALQALGYSAAEAITAISELPDDGEKTVEARVLAALQKLGTS